MTTPSNEPSKARPRPIRFASLPFHPMSTPEAVSLLAARDPSAPFAPYVTPNVEFVFWRARDENFRACFDAAYLSTNDSRVLRRLGRFAGLDLGFAPGAYVVRALFETVVKPDDPITIIGCSTEIVAGLAARYHLRAVAHHNPPMGFIHNAAAVAEAVAYVADHPARFVFVAMGPPQSEAFCAAVIQSARATGIGLCIGSSLSVLSGSSQPAPDLIETAGLVWLYRLAQEPQRLWRRYLVRDPVGVASALKDVVALRLGLRRAEDV